MRGQIMEYFWLTRNFLPLPERKKPQKPVFAFVVFNKWFFFS